MTMYNMNEILASCRDFTLDIYHAGRLAVAGILDKIDTKLADAINGPDD